MSSQLTFVTFLRMKVFLVKKMSLFINNDDNKPFGIIVETSVEMGRLELNKNDP